MLLQIFVWTTSGSSRAPSTPVDTCFLPTTSSIASNVSPWPLGLGTNETAPSPASRIQLVGSRLTHPSHARQRLEHTASLVCQCFQVASSARQSTWRVGWILSVYLAGVSWEREIRFLYCEKQLYYDFLFIVPLIMKTDIYMIGTSQTCLFIL